MAGKAFDWGAQDWNIVSQIGERPDAEIASMVGCHQATVRLYRKKLGIPSFYEKHPIRINWGSVDLHSNQTSAELAEVLGCTVHTVKGKRREMGITTRKRNTVSSTIDWANVGLGTKSDHKVAAELGCSQALVYIQREKLGIPPFGSRKQRVQAPKGE